MSRAVNWRLWACLFCPPSSMSTCWCSHFDSFSRFFSSCLVLLDVSSLIRILQIVSFTTVVSSRNAEREALRDVAWRLNQLTAVTTCGIASLGCVRKARVMSQSLVIETQTRVSARRLHIIWLGLVQFCTSRAGGGEGDGWHFRINNRIRFYRENVYGVPQLICC